MFALILLIIISLPVVFSWLIMDYNFRKVNINNKFKLILLVLIQLSLAIIASHLLSISLLALSILVLNYFALKIELKVVNSKLIVRQTLNYYLKHPSAKSLFVFRP